MAGFVINFPRRSRPRGLGYAGMDGVAGPLSGMGTWVVDAEYGLGPRFREGYNRPYPPEAMPTRYPRAQAARVLGPGAGVNVVARPYAATRLATTRSPVRMAPITAPGARLRNPGVSGYGDTLAVAAAAQDPAVYGSVLGGIAIGFGARFLPKGGARSAASLAALGWMGFGLYNFWQGVNADAAAIARETADREIPDVGVATTRGALSNTQAVLRDGAAAPDSAKMGVLQQFAVYENARRTDTWWRRMRGTALNPLQVTNMTAAQAAQLAQAFRKIPRADRGRLMAVYRPGHSLANLG